MARIELSNIGGGGTTLSLTTTGTSGASTLAGSVLNIPVYQGQLTLTTTGTSGAATLSGDILNIPQYSGGGTPAGSTGEIQYNNAGAFGASANLAWDNANVRLNIGAPSAPTARLNVKGAGTLSSTVNLRLTNSGNTELVSVLDNGQVNFSTNLTTIDPSTEGLTIVSQGTSVNRGLTISQHNNGINGPLTRARKSRGTLSSPTNVLSGDFVGVFEFSGYIGGAYSGDRSIFGAAMTSTTGISQYFCTGTTNGNYTPTLLVAENGNVGVGSIGGTIITSLTLPSAKLQIRGSNTSSGTNALLVQNNRSPTPDDIYKIENDGKISYLATNTAAGTTGAQTINRPSGTVNFAAGATSLVVTNSLCTTSSIVFATVRTNDATATIKNVVPAAGSFTINLSAAATAETSVGFFIIN